MKGKGRSRQAILAAVTVLTVAQAGTAYASTGPASESGVQTGRWIQEGQNWKYQGSDGTIKTGWVKTESGWYYLDPATGQMMTGWITVNGQRYYMNTAADGIEGQMHRGWLKDNAGKWYFFSTASDATEGMAVTGWQWIDGKCYYFGSDAENFGQMHADGQTPDGYTVNADGQWVGENGEVQTRAEKGYLSNPAAAGTASSASTGSSGSSHSSGSGNSHSGNSGNGNSGSQNGGNAGDSGNNDSNGDQNGGNAGDNGSNGNQNGGNAGDNGENGNQNGGNAGNNGNTENPDKPQMVSLVDETKTKLAEVNSLGWWLPIAFDEGYNAENTVVKVDGKDVTNLLTPITDDGRMAKLALLGTPGKVTVSSKDDAVKEETVVLSNESQEDAVYDSVGGEGYLPEKILTHEPVALWDYYLTNYDEDGNARISPKKTTYNLGEEKQTHPSYSPDAVLPENGNATVTIMFNYNTDEEKQWFDGIRKLALVSYDEQKSELNKSLDFDSEKNVAHGQGHVGQLTIKTGQDNFRSNGRYYVRVASSAGGSVLVPIHVVNETVPTLELKETPQSGKNLHFAVSNLVYGIETPIERVTLEDPTGKVSDLQMIDDWYLYSQDLFVLYNDNTDHLPYRGNYTITVYANGFQAFSKSFKVSTGADPVKEKEQTNGQRVAAYGFDGVSTASTGSGGSGSSSGSSSGSYAISANLVFDTDLLVNAHLLEMSEMENDASKAVMEWWYNAIPDAVFDTGDEDFFQWTDYVNKSENQKYKEDRMLPFADYRDMGELDPNHPATAKEVLEDGLLGDIQSNGNFSRLDAPTLTVEQNEEGKPVVMKTDDTEYVKAIQGIVVNGNWQALSKEKYTIDAEEGTITIQADVFKAGEEYKLTIDAAGYKSAGISFTYDKVMESDLSLTVDYADGNEAFIAKKTESGKNTYYFADAAFTVEGSEEDFLKNLKSITLLALDEEDAEEKNVYTKGYEGGNAVYYVISEDGKTFTLHNVQPGRYQMTVRANYYTEALRCEFVVEKEEENVPDVTEIQIQPVQVKKSTSYGEKGYIIQFSYSDGTELTEQAYKKALETYVNSINYVKVGTTTYSPQSGWFSLGDAEYAPKAYDTAYSFSKDSLLISDSAFNKEGDTLITIKGGDEYPEVTLIIDKNGNLKQDEELLTPPTLTGPKSISEGSDLTLSGTADTDELEKYLSAIKTVTSDGDELEYEVKNHKLIIKTEGLTAGPDGSAVEIVIEADGYEEQTIEVEIESSEEKVEIEVSSVTKESSFWGTNLLIRFTGVEGEELKTFLTKIDSVEVNGKEYTKGFSSAFLGSGEFAPHATDTSYGNGSYDCLKVSASELSEEEDNVIIISAEGYGEIECRIDKNWKLIKEEKNLIADEVLPVEIITAPEEKVTTPEEVPAEKVTPEEPKADTENKAEVPDGGSKDETEDADKAPESDEDQKDKSGEDKKDESDESKDTSDEKKDETSDTEDGNKEDSNEESGEKENDSKDDASDKDTSDDGKKEESADAKKDDSDDSKKETSESDKNEKDDVNESASGDAE